MQKLKFINGNGVEVDLTDKVNYGIIAWEGFSADGLNIQSQQVPFQDGGVFLDALMEQRELSVTVAINAKGDLDKRYRLRRELISVLNPKLGEGVLIYTDNYLSKQIHVIPQIPLFDTNNSNDSGTPKVSCSFTACNPYWEDLEDTDVTFSLAKQPIIKNEGDIPTQIKMEWFTSYVKNGQVTNITQNQKIKYNGNLNKVLKINTEIGKKNVVSEEMLFNMNNYGLDINEVIYSEKHNVFVAVGNYCSVLTSSDGVIWKSNTIIGVDSIRAITYSEDLDLFVCCNGSVIYTSSDLENWTFRNITGLTSILRSIIYSETLNLFVAVGDSGCIVTSPDGVNWTIQNSGLSVNFRDITYVEYLSLFVVVGASGKILTSPDGINWTKRTTPTSYNFHSITYSNKLNLVLAVGQYGIIYSSEDGITWNDQYAQNNYVLNGVIYSEILNLFVAVGYSGRIMTSPDGVNWTIITNTFSSTFLNITYSKSLNMFVACGERIITTSPDGVDWIQQLSGVNKDIKSVVYSEKLKLFVAVGESGYILTSLNGKDWTLQNSGINTNINCIIYLDFNEVFFAVGDSGKLLTSVDGINWTNQTISASDLNSIVYSKNKNLFVVIGSSGVILTSTNGTTWTSRTSGVSTKLNAIAYSEDLGLFVVVGNSGVILTSSNGSSWTSRTSGISATIFNIIYAEKIFIIIGGAGNILSSNNGINWISNKPYGSDGLLKGITFSKELNCFITVGNSNFSYISYDGTNWTRFYVNTSIQLNSIIYINNLDCFLITGYGGAILQSYFRELENEIQNISADSDIGMNLAIGDNKFRINVEEGNLVVKIKFRQKYIGV